MRLRQCSRAGVEPEINHKLSELQVILSVL